MTPGVSTWEQLEPVDGNLLVVVNSKDDDRDGADALLTVLERRQPSAIVHAIAASVWRPWLERRGLAADRLLIAEDEDGRDVELNHFLESPAAILWSVPKQFRCITGTEPHSVYNEEVKDIFERRVLLLLGDGRFLAHTLPNAYVYVLDLVRLVERCGRELKVQTYQRQSRAIVEDLHRLWLASGRPAVADGPDYGDVMQVLERRMGRALLDFDEAGPIPLRHDRITAAFAEVVSHVRDVVSEHDRQLSAMTALHAERSEAVAIRERLLAELSAERVAAVDLRDRIIEDLHLQLEPWHRKLRRRWHATRGVKGQP
jgi:hypothetical protein